MTSRYASPETVFDLLPDRERLFVTARLFQQGAPVLLGIRNHGKEPGAIVASEPFHHVAPQLQRFIPPTRVVQRRSPVHQRVAKRLSRIRQPCGFGNRSWTPLQPTWGHDTTKRIANYFAPDNL